MRLLLDNNLSLRLAEILIMEGWDIAHVGALGLRAASDDVVLSAAREGGHRLVDRRSFLADVDPLAAGLVDHDRHGVVRCRQKPGASRRTVQPRLWSPWGAVGMESGSRFRRPRASRRQERASRAGLAWPARAAGGGALTSDDVTS